jgi:RNA-binding motif X-linked protein 2
VYIGGLPYELSEGDIVTIFSQYGEPVHINLVRDKDTGKSKGFAFLKYEDQRSTVLAVDNLGGANVLGRTIRVDHCRYKPKEGDGTELIGKGPAAGGEREDGERHSKRRKSRSAERSPTPEMLQEEIELRKLIRDHDEDDPMKDWLVREKKKEVEEARKKRDMTMSKHRSRNQEKEKSRHRSYRRRSKSRERKHRSDSREREHRSRSREHKERHRPDRGPEQQYKGYRDRGGDSGARHRDDGGREMSGVRDDDIKQKDRESDPRHRERDRPRYPERDHRSKDDSAQRTHRDRHHRDISGDRTDRDRRPRDVKRGSEDG